MPDGLVDARAMAEAVRFGGDRPSGMTPPPASSGAALSAFFRHNELQICEAVTPLLHDVMAHTARRLRMRTRQIEAYVFENPAVQAYCLVHNGDCCLVRFSSGIVNLLSPEELGFIVGHEIGHHLLGHAHVAPDDRSLEEQMAARASEISADRVGLLACGSIETAARALMKSLSGLPNRLVRFDVGRYLAQFGDTSMQADARMTHPSMGVRCRALLWFASAPNALEGSMSARDRAAIDARVGKDLQRYMDMASIERIAVAERNLALWVAVDAIIGDGRMSRAERAWLVENFGADVASSVASMLAGGTWEDATKLVQSRRETALRELQALVPRTWQQREQEALRVAATKPC